jgi:hypothetical protein
MLRSYFLTTTAPAVHVSPLAGPLSTVVPVRDVVLGRHLPVDRPVRLRRVPLDPREQPFHPWPVFLHHVIAGIDHVSGKVPSGFATRFGTRSSAPERMTSSDSSTSR